MRCLVGDFPCGKRFSWLCLCECVQSMKSHFVLNLFRLPTLQISSVSLLVCVYVSFVLNDGCMCKYLLLSIRNSFFFYVREHSLFNIDVLSTHVYSIRHVFDIFVALCSDNTIFTNDFLNECKGEEQKNS